MIESKPDSNYLNLSVEIKSDSHPIIYESTIEEKIVKVNKY